MAYDTTELRSSRIMIVDDEAVNLKVLERMLESQGYLDIIAIQDSRNVIKQYQQAKPDLILLDLNMPYFDGHEILAQLKDLDDPLLPPIVLLTALHGRDVMLQSLEKGARDFITKPFDMAELLARVRNMLEVHAAHQFVHAEKLNLEDMVLSRTNELLETRLQIVQRLGRASEYRDNETGRHIVRVSRTAAMLARSLGWKSQDIENLLHATPMHDLGKIGIPDSILLKPGKLIGEEWEIMKTHTTIGANILGGDHSVLLRLAEEIALSHHERWDGKGYPIGLQGEAIPESGLIVALSDVFDALTSERPYKTAWTVDEAVHYLTQNRGKHFSPPLVDIFIQSLPEILEMRSSLAD
jgi:putative two-component system response regulator